MALRIYNTLSQKKEPFRPIADGKVGMYVCGVTVYDVCHIGHARAYVAFDVVHRYLEHLGYDVTYVRNFTDVDDKIIKRAAEAETTTGELTERCIAAFHEDMAALNVAPVDVEPRVTGHIPEIIETIGRILDNGHGYVTDGDVLFSIDSFPDYARLSRRKLDEMVAGGSERVAVDERKRNPLDFVLWKASKPGEPKWASPWGDGRPGWHIECSTMSHVHLGDRFDIHGGGKDLVFPHHENEIAQSQAAFGAPPVNVWMHNGFVNVDEEKMAKSVGNFVTIRDAVGLYHPRAVRYFLLTTHYRSPINYCQDNLEEATTRIEYIFETIGKMDRWLAAGPTDGAEGEILRPELLDGVVAGFREAMDDDFNTARAIGLLSEILSFANEVIDGRNKKTKKRRYATLVRIREVLLPVLSVLGLFEDGDDPRALCEAICDRKIARLTITRDEIEARIADRTQARADRDFARADAIRDELAAHGVVLMDGPEGTCWKIGSCGLT